MWEFLRENHPLISLRSMLLYIPRGSSCKQYQFCLIVPMEGNNEKINMLFAYYKYKTRFIINSFYAAEILKIVIVIVSTYVFVKLEVVAIEMFMSPVFTVYCLSVGSTGKAVVGLPATPEAAASSGKCRQTPGPSCELHYSIPLICKHLHWGSNSKEFENCWHMICTPVAMGPCTHSEKSGNSFFSS